MSNLLSHLVRLVAEGFFHESGGFHRYKHKLLTAEVILFDNIKPLETVIRPVFLSVNFKFWYQIQTK